MKYIISILFIASLQSLSCDKFLAPSLLSIIKEIGLETKKLSPQVIQIMPNKTKFGKTVERLLGKNVHLYINMNIHGSSVKTKEGVKTVVLSNNNSKAWTKSELTNYLKNLELDENRPLEKKELIKWYRRKIDINGWKSRVVKKSINGLDTSLLKILPKENLNSINSYAYYLKKFYKTELFMAHPDFFDHFTMGFYNPGTNQIWLNSEQMISSSEFEIRQVILHEARHAQFALKDNSILRSRITNTGLNDIESFDHLPYFKYLNFEEFYTYSENIYFFFLDSGVLPEHTKLVLDIAERTLEQLRSVISKPSDFNVTSNLNLSSLEKLGLEANESSEVIPYSLIMSKDFKNQTPSVMEVHLNDSDLSSSLLNLETMLADLQSMYKEVLQYNTQYNNKKIIDPDYKVKMQHKLRNIYSYMKKYR